MLELSLGVVNAAIKPKSFVFSFHVNHAALLFADENLNVYPRPELLVAFIDNIRGIGIMR